MNTRVSVEKAANILNVSTLYVYGLINRGELFAAGGRLLRSEVLAYKMIQDAVCDKAVEELVEESEKLGLYE